MSVWCRLTAVMYSGKNETRLRDVGTIPSTGHTAGSPCYLRVCNDVPKYPDAKRQISLSKLDAHLKALATEQSLLASENTAVTKKSKAGAPSVQEGTKKRKKDSRSSQGVEKLKKANVSGMSKLSTFFTKKGD